MARELSPFIQGLFDQAALTGERKFNSQVALDITLSNGTPYYVASGSFIMDSISRKGESIDIDPISYEGRAIELPNLRHNTGAPMDAGEFALANLDYVLSALIPEPTRLFENARCKVWICFPKADGNYEGVGYFAGLIRGLTGLDEEVQLQLISDLSDKTATVAEEITQRCTNELGDYVVGGKCGATHLPPGATCSKDFDDAINGCIFWGQMHAFAGIHFINPTGLVAGYGGGGLGGGGWGGGCVDPYSFVKGADGIYRQAHTLNEGDLTLDLKGRVGLIEKIEEVHVFYRYLVELSNGAKLKCSADHPITTDWDDEEGRQAYAMRPYVEFLNGDIPEPHRILSEANGEIGLIDRWHMTPLGPGTVLRFSMAVTGKTKNFASGMAPGYTLDGHNSKPIYNFNTPGGLS